MASKKLITAKELQNWATDFLPVLRDINIAIINLRIIEEEDAKYNLAIKHASFRFLWYQQRFILIVQLTKLFSDKHERSYVELCRRFKKHNFDSEIDSQLEMNNSQENNSDLRDLFRSREEMEKSSKTVIENFEIHKALIAKIKDLRNDIYAHTASKKTNHKISSNELGKLVAFASDIYNELFGKIFDKHYFFHLTDNWDLRYIVRNVSSQ